MIDKQTKWSRGWALFVLVVVVVVVVANDNKNEAHCRIAGIAAARTAPPLTATRNATVLLMTSQKVHSTKIHSIIECEINHKSCSKMFSWSSKGHKASGYPGARSSGGGSGSGVSRDEHIQSYLNDPTLKPSTRRVSAGENALVRFTT